MGMLRPYVDRAGADVRVAQVNKGCVKRKLWVVLRRRGQGVSAAQSVPVETELA